MPSCLIVGASRGIGREFVNQYLADGWTVHATARGGDDLADLEQAGATAHRADAAKEDDLKTLAAALPDDLDVIVHNAGVNTASMEGPITDVDAEEWTRVMQVNALAPILSARNLIPKLKKPGGTFAILSSLMGSIADNGFGGFWSYRMSKAAVNMAAQNLAHQFEGDGTAILTLHPGHVQTDMGGAGAPVTPTESVTGLRNVIAKKAPGDGTLFVDFRGKALAW
ncbi:MAG: SDR family oxidoreductase [Pacificimonas sp.]|jgi:NAD(P)-dependent dehydrogenase (short-subunit alcohol dehydrogenase family)|nr:SDR family oxidoreductase [Pacificimonas sp.]